jgi:hypothetical protein
MDRFKEMMRLFDEASAANAECEVLLIDLWRTTKDARIEALFRDRGGCMIDGVFMFSEDNK